MGVRAVRAALVIAACMGCTQDEIRQATYPPDFHYVTPDEVKGTMGGLAVEIHRLEELMEREGGPGPEDRDRVIEILTRMQELARELKTGTRSNHPRIHRAAPWIQEDIQRALHGARATPPSYYFAGQVSGACTYCHVPRHREPVLRPLEPSPEPAPHLDR